MQYTLRSLLVALAVAGLGAGLFRFRYPALHEENGAWILGTIIVALFGATLLGLVCGRNKRGIKRILWFVAPAAIVAAALAHISQKMTQSWMATNAMSAALVCRLFGDSQDKYFRTDWKHDGVNQYAQSMQDLFNAMASAGPTLLTQEIVDAEWGPKARPFRGYYFKILKKQILPVERSYIDANNRMTQGYALVAWPARYGGTGSVLYLISNAGTIYPYDYGPATEQIGRDMEEFNPVWDRWCLLDD